jgi:hypothetical protein
MSRSFLAAIRSAVFPNSIWPGDTAAVLQATSAPHVAAPAPLPAATHPAAAADLSAGRFSAVAKAPEFADSPKQLRAALQLVELAPDMSAERIVAWVVAHVPTADKPARTIPTLMERAEEAQRMADSLGASSDNSRNGWGAAIDEAHRRHKIN